MLYCIIADKCLKNKSQKSTTYGRRTNIHLANVIIPDILALAQTLHNWRLLFVCVRVYVGEVVGRREGCVASLFHYLFSHGKPAAVNSPVHGAIMQ